MPLRRLASLSGLGLLAAAFAGACMPWSVAEPGLKRFVARELARSYGVALRAEGPVEVALLPLPRLGFSGVRLNAGDSDGPALAEGGTLSLQLNLLALLAGRIDVNTLALDGATIRMPAGPADTRWAEPLRLLEARLDMDGTSHPRRISLVRVTATGSDPRDGTPQTARDIDLSLSWPLWSAQAEVTGSFRWNEGPARFTVAGLRIPDLLGGRASPLTLSASWAAGSLAVEGEGAMRDGSLKLTGRGSFATRSLPETMTWAGGAVTLAPFVERFGLDGSFEMDGRRLLLPSVRVSVGSNVLEGAGSVAFDRDRPAVQATLAAESLNLAPLLAETMRMLGLDPAEDGDASGAGRSLALAPLTGADFDLRLSAGTARIGPIRGEDVAASVLVRPGQIEASLNRASLGGGTLKGRLALQTAGSDPAVTEVKAQSAFDGLDLGAVLGDLGQDERILGRVQGQFLAQSSGATARELLARMDGHAAFGVEGGTLIGLDLAEIAQRQRAPIRRGGRTSFERASLSLRVTGGVMEIVEGAMEGSALSASLRGAVSLPDRRCAAVADVVARAPVVGAPRLRPAQFRIDGPLSDLAVRPVPATSDPDPRDGSVPAPNALRQPAGAPATQLPPTARAFAP